jgi:hypothetical protein
MSETTLLSSHEAAYLTDAIRQGIFIYGLIGPNGKPFVPDFDKITKVFEQTEVSPGSDKMQFKIPEIVRDNPDEGNINSHLFRGQDKLQRDFVLRRVCKTHLTAYQPNGFKRWINMAERNVYQKFAGKGLGMRLDSESVGRDSREELQELLHISSQKGYDYYTICDWEQQYPLKRVFGGGDARFHRPLCFFPGLDFSSLGEDGKNYAREMLYQFSLAKQQPRKEEVIAQLLGERDRKHLV